MTIFCSSTIPISEVQPEMNLQKPIVIYDGECRFCIDQVRRIKQMDMLHQLEYIPRQDPTADLRFPMLRTIDFDKGMRLLTADGNNYAGADAVYQIARRLPATRPIAWLYCIPGINQIAKLIYTWIARNRKRLGQTCDDASCKTFR